MYYPRQPCFWLNQQPLYHKKHSPVWGKKIPFRLILLKNVICWWLTKLVLFQVQGRFNFVQLKFKAEKKRLAVGLDLWAEWLSRWNLAEATIILEFDSTESGLINQAEFNQEVL